MRWPGGMGGRHDDGRQNPNYRGGGSHSANSCHTGAYMIWTAILSSRPVRWIIGAGVAVLGFLGIIAAARRDAARDAITQAENAEARAYINKRQEIDNADLGQGATDLERIKRLHDIANRERGGGD